MEQKNLVLCGSNFYEQKYYFNEKQFGRLPRAVKEELQVMCVLFTEDVGGAGLVEIKEIAGGKERTFGIAGTLLPCCNIRTGGTKCCWRLMLEIQI